jgi:hypothetical protein
MTDRPTVALGASSLALACFLAACGSYDNPPKPDAGGAGGSGGSGGSGGTMTSGGAGAGGATGGGAGTGGATGGTGGATTGGAAGMSGQAGSAAGMPPGGAGGMGDAGGSGAGSGGGSGQPVCPANPVATPCGGSVTGTWVAASCELTVSGMANLAPLGIGCSAAPITGMLTVSGTWTATAEGMYTDNTVTSGNVELELPPACLEVSGFQTTCDRIVFDPIGLPYTDVNTFPCMDNADTMGCSCSIPVQQMGGIVSIHDWTQAGPNGEAPAPPTSGTFTTMENTLVTKTTTQVETEYGYCVDGTSLTMNLAAPGLAGTIMGPVVLEKQP